MHAFASLLAGEVNISTCIKIFDSVPCLWVYYVKPKSSMRRETKIFDLVAYAFKTLLRTGFNKPSFLKSKIFVSLRILLFFKILAVVPYFNNPYVVLASTTASSNPCSCPL